MFNVQLERMTDVQLLMELQRPMISPNDFGWIQRNRPKILALFWELKEITGQRLSPVQKDFVEKTRHSQRTTREDHLLDQVESLSLKNAQLKDVLTGVSLLLPKDSELLPFVENALKD